MALGSDIQTALRSIFNNPILEVLIEIKLQKF